MAYLTKHPKADPSIISSEEGTVLHVLAGRWGEILEGHELFHRILSAAPEHTINLQDGSGRTALHYLAKHCKWDALQKVLGTPGIQPDMRDRSERTPLINAVEALNLDGIKSLAIRRDVDISALRRPIEIAGTTQSPLEYLLSNRVGLQVKIRGEILTWLKTICKELTAELDWNEV